MREIDRLAIASCHVPGVELMERAGAAVARAVRELGPTGRVAVLCGPGNNGGDGYVVARLLHAEGRKVEVIGLAPPERHSADARAMREKLVAAGLAVSAPETLQVWEDGGPASGDVVIDALLGTGLTRAPEGEISDAVGAIAVARKRGARVIAVDIPTGLSADTGQPLGPCVQADRTVTFGFLKQGMVQDPGESLCGALGVADIGLPAAACAGVELRSELLEEDEVRRRLPRRPPAFHKGDAGHLLLVAGSAGKSGAAHLAALGALRGGAGLVTIASRPEVLATALAGAQEAMGVALGGSGPLGRGDLEALLVAARGTQALAIGPGIFKGPETAEVIRSLLGRAALPAVLDADGLNAFALQPNGAEQLRGLAAPLVITPHPGEMARLCGITAGQVQADRIGLAAAKARAWGITVVLKGARTVIADPGGRVAVVPTGNPGMATAGSGDVLAGLVGALLAGGLSPGDAARVGTFAHGLAGDLAAERLGQRGLMAGELAVVLGEVWARWGR
jgi:NAD(P)H-hydrate epimerase